MTESKHAMLEAWERCNTLANINKDEGGEAAQDYFDKFNEQDQFIMKTVLLMVSTNGRADTLKRIQESVDEDSKTISQ